MCGKKEIRLLQSTTLRSTFDMLRSLPLAMVAGLILVQVVTLISGAIPPYPQTSSGSNVDLFTNKTPFDGKGANQTCDAFAPQEKIMLYALATYNSEPVCNRRVSFSVTGPSNPYMNVTIVRVASTNGSGMAECWTRVPWPSDHGEEITFGIWNASASVDTAGLWATDSMPFRVGWIVRVESLTTLNNHLDPQTEFPILSTVVFDLIVDNIAFAEKSINITINVQDAFGRIVVQTMLMNVFSQPGESRFLVYGLIRGTARVGIATANASAYILWPKNEPVANSPSVSTTFAILPRNSGRSML